MRSDIVEFNGVRYYRYPESPRPSLRNYYQRPGDSLHRAIWRSKRGPIPDGYEVNHIDHDTLNNDISNLECIPRPAHRSESAHSRKGRERTCTQCGTQFTAKSANKWGSDRWFCSGRCASAWRRAAGLDRGEIVCQECGNRVQTTNFRKQRFCSNRCSAFVRARTRNAGASG